MSCRWTECTVTGSRGGRLANRLHGVLVNRLTQAAQYRLQAGKRLSKHAQPFTHPPDHRQ